MSSAVALQVSVPGPLMTTNFQTKQSHIQDKMPPTTIRTAPSTADFTPLAEWQSQTPETFHGGKPVLYYHATGAKALVPKSQIGKLPFFPEDASATASEPEASVIEGSEEQVEQTVDLFVNSE
jgi:nucleotide-sensitive chloride channel 1A